MAAPTISKNELLRALKALGDAVGGYDEVEIVLVGGLAARLGGWLPESLTTKDADVIAYDPEHAWAYVESEASRIGQAMGLPARWLNSAAHGYMWALPEGWRTRLHRLGDFGLIHVSYVDRLDLIALKIVASRDVDRTHLLAMKVSAKELAFADEHLSKLERDGVAPDRIAKARTTIEILRAAP